MSEQRRIETIERLKRVAPSASQRFAGIAEMAALIFDAPMAGITVLDADTQLFYAAFGFEAAPVPRDIAFCRYTIQADAPFVVEDAHQDPRFADNPYVVSEPYVRFYAGAPIIWESGVRLGALMVIDDKPRMPTARQIDLLRGLSQTVADGFRLLDAAQRQTALLEEISKRERENRRRAEALDKASAVFDVASDLASLGSWSIDLETRELTWSRGVHRIFGRDADTTPSIEQALSYYPDEARRQLEAALANTEADGGRFDLELPVIAEGGEWKWLLCSGRADPPGQSSRVMYGCVLDVTAQRRAQLRIENLARRDPLTGLHNRRATTEAFYRLCADAANAGERVIAMIVDLDRFKEINDSFGLAAGDAVLRAIGEILTASARSTDIVGRLGGDEFIILAQSADTEEAAVSITLRIFDGFRSSAELQRIGATIIPSIGGAEVEPAEPDFSTTLSQTYFSLKEAKARGGRRAVVYDDEIAQQREARETLFEDVKRGLAAHEFFPRYQPKICLRTGAIVGFEALARWAHPERGELTPGAFWNALQDDLLAGRISDEVLTRVIEDGGALKERGVDPGRLAVNITKRQLENDLFLDSLLNALDAHDLGPEDIKFELTENMLLSDRREQTRRRLEALAKLDIMLAFDDFGTGYASLTHLMEFPINRIKIDKSFVLTINEDQNARIIVSAIIRLGRELGLGVVAEGVETWAIHKTICDLGCDFGQGFLYGKPMTVDALPEFIGTPVRIAPPVAVA